ncbi:hypothetical protein AMECASPLE_036059 [Ameca splendens]|uniref:Uncharacterized protein n=1 Tax=Ameca splendens TaxID=208324 RepID=A0ABV0XWH4_9TELE
MEGSALDAAMPGSSPDPGGPCSMSSTNVLSAHFQITKINVTSAAKKILKQKQQHCKQCDLLNKGSQNSEVPSEIRIRKSLLLVEGTVSQDSKASMQTAAWIDYMKPRTQCHTWILECLKLWNIIRTVHRKLHGNVKINSGSQFRARCPNYTQVWDLPRWSSVSTTPLYRSESPQSGHYKKWP